MNDRDNETRQGLAFWKDLSVLNFEGEHPKKFKVACLFLPKLS